MYMYTCSLQHYYILPPRSSLSSVFLFLDSSVYIMVNVVYMYVTCICTANTCSRFYSTVMSPTFFTTTCMTPTFYKLCWGTCTLYVLVDWVGEDSSSVVKGVKVNNGCFRVWDRSRSGQQLKKYNAQVYICMYIVYTCSCMYWQGLCTLHFYRTTGVLWQQKRES